MSVGLAKACVPGKNCTVPEKIEFLIRKPNRMRSLHSFTDQIIQVVTLMMV